MAKAVAELKHMDDLRRTFASRALALGKTLPVIGKVLRHNNIETTARYAHLAQDSVHQAADRIARSIAQIFCKDAERLSLPIHARWVI